MKSFVWIFLILGFQQTVLGSLPETEKNGVLRTGTALNELLDSTQPVSAFSRCRNENAGSRLFERACARLIDQLQKKMMLMTVESDIRIQAERISPLARAPRNQARIALLAKLNLISNQAEYAIKTLKSETPENRIQDRLEDLLPALARVRSSFEAYRKVADGAL